MSNKFTQKAQNTLSLALSFAREFGHSYVGSEHILLGLISEKESIAARLLSARGAEADRIRRSIIDTAGLGSPSALPTSDMTPRVKKILAGSAAESRKNGTRYIGTEHLLMALLQERDCVAVRILESEGIPAEDLKNDLCAYLSSSSEKPLRSSHSHEKEESLKIRGAPTLSAYGRDLTESAAEGRIDPIIGREAETDRVIRILSRRTKNNPCLLGEPGVGKTAVVEGLAERISEGRVPPTLLGKRIITLDIPSMIAGAKYRGEFEERMKHVMEEVRKNPDIILFIDEIHVIIGAGAAEGAVDAANILKPALARGELQMIGATTLAEYRAHIERDAALERRFQSVQVGEPTPEETKDILRGLREKYEEHHGLSISEEAIDAAVSLSVRYLADRFLPDKAIDLLDEAAAGVRIGSTLPSPDSDNLEEELRSLSAEKEVAVCAQNFQKAATIHERERQIREELEQKRIALKERPAPRPTVGARDIADVITNRTGIPISRLMEDESKRLLGLEEELKKQVIGQDSAISALARAIRRGRMGLKDPKRPIGSFILIGPSGVGKSELARALATQMFGSPSALIRLDMSEYMEKHSVSRLIGSPPGYVGYEEGGQLTEKIRRRPYSVILFDEMEKAHPDVFNLLLQVLEDGTLTDSKGHRVDFANTVILMTSNLGHGEKKQSRILGFSAENREAERDAEKKRMFAVLRERFRGEFLNRVDEIILFHSLSEEDLTRIAEGMLREIADRAEGLGIHLRFDSSVAHLLTREEDENRGGARPLRRRAIRMVEDPLSLALLEGRFSGGDSLLLSVPEGETEVRFEKVS